MTHGEDMDSMSSRVIVSVLMAAYLHVGSQSAGAQSWPEAPEKWSLPVEIPELSRPGLTFLSCTLTADERTIYMTWDSKIVVSHRVDSVWSTPVELGSTINAPGMLVEAPSVSPDGRTLYVRAYVGTWVLFGSTWSDSLGDWQTPQDLGFNINQYGAWFGMTPDNNHLYFHRHGLPRISTWDESNAEWGPSEWLDYYRFLDSRHSISLPASKRKIYYDAGVPKIDLIVHYYDTTLHEWSFPMKLNVQRLIDSAYGSNNLQFSPWVSADGRHLYFTSNHEGRVALYRSDLLIDENGDTVVTEVASTPGSAAESPEDVQTYPNPFNARTWISFSLASPSRVQVRVYDILGRETGIRHDLHLEAGDHKVVVEAMHLASGVYVCTLLFEGVLVTKSLILIR
jgi:hypothetical protein